MLLPPPDLDERALLRMVDEHYGARDAALRFEPAGEDSWCYRLGDLWISLRRDLQGHVPVAYECCALMSAVGLRFVLAPLRGSDGRLVHEVGGYPVLVFPYMAVTTFEDDPPSHDEVAEIAVMVAQVHLLPLTSALPTEDFQLPFDGDLDLALAPERIPPDAGPYAAPLARLLARHRDYVAQLRAEFRVLAVFCAAADEPFSATHGEPIPSNLLRCGDRLLIGDWGGLMWSPPERDWAQLERTLDLPSDARPEFMRLYEIRWILSEIAEYVSVLARPHVGHRDDRAMWRRLLCYLPAAG